MADDGERDSLISSLVSVTGHDPERSKLYLESTGWNLDLAIQTFYEEFDEDAEAAARAQAASNEEQRASSASPVNPVPSQQPDQALDLASLLRQPPASAVDMSNPSGSRKKEPQRGIATLGSLRQQQQDSDSSDDDNQQAFYAGGSERSGQQVLGPPGSKKRDPDEVVAEMFKAAKEHGGQVVDPSEVTKKKPSAAFAGQGFRLGTEPGETAAPAVPSSSAFEPPQAREMCLRLWRNGFTVDEGELRTFDDPSNAEFLAAIKAGNIPRELVTLARGGEVSLNMEDHRHEDYVPTKKKPQAFTGEGHRLGSVAPSTHEDISMESASQGDEEAARNSLKLDESQPTTSIQIRLADSTRLVLKLNLTHTVSQIRAYICAVRPAMAARPFTLLTTFPNKELSEEGLTVEEANLKNAVIVQRFI